MIFIFKIKANECNIVKVTLEISYAFAFNQKIFRKNVNRFFGIVIRENFWFPKILHGLIGVKKCSVIKEILHTISTKDPESALKFFNF